MFTGHPVFLRSNFGSGALRFRESLACAPVSRATCSILGLAVLALPGLVVATMPRAGAIRAAIAPFHPKGNGSDLIQVMGRAGSAVWCGRRSPATERPVILHKDDGAQLV